MFDVNKIGRRGVCVSCVCVVCAIGRRDVCVCVMCVRGVSCMCVVCHLCAWCVVRLHGVCHDCVRDESVGTHGIYVRCVCVIVCA